MQKFSKVSTFMVAMIALTFCTVSCKSSVDDEPTKYTVTVASSIEHGKVSVDNSSAEAGTTIKLTATADDGYELDSYSVKDASSNAITVTDDTFVMPKSNVTVSATFVVVTYIGTKKPSLAKAVGDIVFTDGSAMPYADFTALGDDAKAEKKTSAIALIFYSGTSLNSGDDTATSRTLGVGLKHNKLAWCLDSANAYSKKIETILCKPDDGGSAGNYTWTGSQDRNGRNNLEQIATFLAAAEDVTDDTATEANYPAFYFAKNYKETATNIADTDYEDGWYLPSFAELFQIYAYRKDGTDGFDLDAASQALGGDEFGTNWYWSSSQYGSGRYAYGFLFLAGVWNSILKDSIHYVCAIRSFN